MPEPVVGHVWHHGGSLCGQPGPLEPLATWRLLYPELQCAACREWLHA